MPGVLVLVTMCPCWLMQRCPSVAFLYLSLGLGKLSMVSFLVLGLRGTQDTASDVPFLQGNAALF